MAGGHLGRDDDVADLRARSIDVIAAGQAPELDVGTLANLVQAEQIKADRGGVHHVVLEPYGYRWFCAGAVTPALARDVVG